jgi:DNA polymerase-1
MRKVHDEFDARTLGCKCDECPFRRSTPIKPKGRLNARGLHIVDTHPSSDGASFIGGWRKYRLDKALGRGPRYETALTLCAPPADVAEKDIGKAIRACSPRLEKEMEKVAQYIVPMSDEAWRWVSGAGSNILNYAGHPYGRAFPVVPFTSVRANPAVIPAFDHLLRRVQATLDGRSSPEPWPTLLTSDCNAAATQLRSWLSQRPPLAFDVETSGKSAFAGLRCIGFSCGDVGVSLTWPLKPELEPLVREILAADDIPLIMHNAQHDWISMEHHGYKIGGKVHDTLLLHAVHALQMPHGLNLVAALTTYRPAWKQLFKDSRSDMKGDEFWQNVGMDELKTYNAKDAIQTAVIFNRLYPALPVVHNGHELYESYLGCMAVAKDMRVKGIRVDEECKERHRLALEVKLAEVKTEFAKHLKSLDIPAVEKYSLGKGGTSSHLKNLFFKVFGVQPIKYSDITREPVLDNSALQKYSVHVEPRVADTARLILTFRKFAKLLNTYINGLPMTNGRVHPEWKVYGTITSRWSSAGPNMQNIPKPNKTTGTPGMRDMFCADPGMTLVAADFSALELRLIALVTRAEKLIRWFQEGKDVHAENAAMFFDKSVAECNDKSIERKLAKNCIYAFTYNMSSDVTTLWETLVLEFPKITIGQVKHLRDKLFKVHPEIPAWQYEAARIANDFKYVEAPLSGRREIFHDGNVDINKVLNYPFQSSGGDLMNKAIIAIHKELDPSRGECVLMQIHDELVLQGPDPQRLADILKRHMAQKVNIDGLELDFPIDVDVGTNWGRMEPMK